MLVSHCLPLSLATWLLALPMTSSPWRVGQPCSSKRPNPEYRLRACIPGLGHSLALCTWCEDTPSPLSPTQLVQVSSTLALLGALGREGPSSLLEAPRTLYLARTLCLRKRCAKHQEALARKWGAGAGAAAAGRAQ